MQWLPPDCDAWMLAGSEGRRTEQRYKGDGRGWTVGNASAEDTDQAAVHGGAWTLQMS